MYKGTIIQNSLVSDDILKKVKINKTWQDGDWILHDVAVDEDQIEEISNSIKPGPWYIHLWKKGEQDIKVLYKNKIFNINYSDKSTWVEAVAYGKSLNIPDKQLDFPIN